MKENSIEEDIKILDHIIMDIKADTQAPNVNTRNVAIRKFKAIEHILSDYIRVLKENEELRLEEKKRIIGRYGEFEIHEVINKVLADDYIPVQKVKDKIEELNNIYNDIPDDEGNFTKAILIKEKQVLQELLKNK